MPAILQAFCFAKLFLLHAKLQQCNTAQGQRHITDSSTTFRHTFRNERKTHYKKLPAIFAGFLFCKTLTVTRKTSTVQHCSKGKGHITDLFTTFRRFHGKIDCKKRRQVFRLFSTFSFPFIYLSRFFRCHPPTFSPDSKKVATIGISHFQCDVLPDFT